MDGRSQIKVHTDERTHVHSAQSSLAVTHPSTNRARRYLNSVTESPSKHWSTLDSMVESKRPHLLCFSFATFFHHIFYLTLLDICRAIIFKQFVVCMWISILSAGSCISIIRHQNSNGYSYIFEVAQHVNLIVNTVNDGGC